MLGRCALSCLRTCHSQLARSAQPAIKPGRYRFRGREGEGGGSTWEHCHPMSPWRERAYLSMRRGFPCDFKHWRLNVPLSKAGAEGSHVIRERYGPKTQCYVRVKSSSSRSTCRTLFLAATFTRNNVRDALRDGGNSIRT